MQFKLQRGKKSSVWAVVMMTTQGKLILPSTPNPVFYIISDYLCSVNLQLVYLKFVKSEWCLIAFIVSPLLECHLIY